MTPTKKDAEAFFKNSLLFQASLGSKELFHSNIWAWLIEMDNDFLGVFFDGINLAETKYYNAELGWTKARISPLASKSPCLAHTATMRPDMAGIISSNP